MVLITIYGSIGKVHKVLFRLESEGKGCLFDINGVKDLQEDRARHMGDKFLIRNLLQYWLM